MREELTTAVTYDHIKNWSTVHLILANRKKFAGTRKLSLSLGLVNNRLRYKIRSDEDDFEDC